MNRFWNFKETDTTRTLYLDGYIAPESWFEDDVSPKEFKTELEAATGDIAVWINSPGGDFFAASQIYTMLKDYSDKVIIKIDGIAASAAAVIAMAGDEVLMSPTAMLMIHNPSTFVWGEESDMQKGIAMLAEVKEAIINSFEVKTGLPRKQIADMMNAETWFSAGRAVELGFADKILYSEVPPQVTDFMFDKVTVLNTLMRKLPARDGLSLKKQSIAKTALHTTSLKNDLNYLNKGENKMNKIIELREKRATVWEQAKILLDEKRGENGLLSAEDTATYEKMETEVVNLGKEVERLERQAAIDLELSKATSAVLKPAPGVGSEKQGRASSEYAQAFWQHMRNRGGYEVRNTLTIGGDGTEGGYLVPDEFERILVEALEEENVMRTLAKVIATSSGDKKIPVVASKGEATWVDEEGPYQDKDDAFGQVSLGAFKLATMIKVSEELLNDSVFNLESYIAKEFARRIGAKEEEAFLVGDGEGKPAGIFDATHGAGVGATATTTIKADDILDLFYSLNSPYRKKAGFIMNNATVKRIRKLKDGQGQYLWQPSLTAGDPDTLLNRPVKTSAYVPTVEASAKVIAFGDFGYYWIADRQGRIFQRLNELYAANGQVGFRAAQRVDGKLILKEAIKILQMKA